MAEQLEKKQGSELASLKDFLKELLMVLGKVMMLMWVLLKASARHLALGKRRVKEKATEKD
jgi:hypothetical protein